MTRRTSRRTAVVCVKSTERLTDQIREFLSRFPSSTKVDHLKREVFSKFVSDDTDPADVRRVRAVNKWLAAERDNEATNERLLLTPGEYNILPRVTFERFTSYCQTLVRDIIGDTPPIDALIGSFSGGASTSRNRTSSFPAGKYLGEAHVTSRCKDLFLDLIREECPQWLLEGFDYEPPRLVVVPGNVMFTVPKKADIDRCACKEPDINMWLQKGIGSFIRRRLKRYHIDLNDQSINRSLAREGSLTGSLATLDLSSASDSVTSELVALLVPATWYTLLDTVRCQVTIIDGEEHSNEMFSSMGNGFTFELESLLFYVLTRATCYFSGISGVISVYGDDIIAPVGVYDNLSWVLGYFGFQVNKDKSFHTGSFRESCGGHYYDGIDITPFYIKGPVKTLTDVIHVANQLREWATIPGLGILDPVAEELWLHLKEFVPSCLWGGEDTSFKYQLVSNDCSSHRIQVDPRKLSTGYGGYLHWLNATWDRTFGSAVSTSSRTIESERIRLRPVRSSAVPRLPSLFLSELR